MKSIEVVVDVFNWSAGERQSDRYGGIWFDDTDQFDLLDGKRVRITATVIEVQECLHIGDLCHGFKHTKPTKGEVHVLGVGTLNIEEGAQILLEPDDKRKTFWMEPWTLYRLLQQKVKLRIEETKEDFTKFPFWSFAGSEQETPEWMKKLLKSEGG